MAEINLGKVVGDSVNKENINNALGFDVKNIEKMTQESYNALPTKDENTLYFIQDEFGKALYKDKSVWDIVPSIPVFFKDPEAKRIVLERLGITDRDYATKEELASITDIEDMFIEQFDLKYFPEFEYFTGLTAIFSDVWEAGYNDGGFNECESLEEIRLPKSLTKLGSSALSFNKLKEIIIPDSVTELGDSCFSYCSELLNIKIPDGVTYLDEECFNDCSALQEITIPKNVTELGISVFGGCFGLNGIFTFEPTVPPIIFYGKKYDWEDYMTSSFAVEIESEITVNKIYVPDESVQAYKTTGNWVNFADKIFPISEK